MMIDRPVLTRDTQLPFVIELVDGSKIETIGGVEAYLRNLSDKQHQCSHWGIAVRMFRNAMADRKGPG